MNPFDKALQQLRIEEEQLRLQHPEESECLFSFGKIESQPTEQCYGVAHPSLDDTRNISADDELKDNEPFVKAPLTDKNNRESTSNPPAANHTLDQEHGRGTGSLDLRLIDQYPCYGVSDRGELTLIGDSLHARSRKTSQSEAEVQNGTFLEESDLSLVLEDNLPKPVSKSVPFVTGKRSHTNVGCVAQDSDTNRGITDEQRPAKICRTAATTSDSLHHSHDSPSIEQPHVTFVADRNACATQKMPVLSTGIEHQRCQIPQDDPFFSELFDELAKTPKVPPASRIFHENHISLTPSARPGLTPNVKAAARFPQTPQTPASSRLTGFSKFSTPLQNPAICAPIEFPKLFKGRASYGTEKRGPSEKSTLVQKVRRLPGALSKQHPIISEATLPRNVTPTSLLDAQVPFQFEDPNANNGNRKNAVTPETLPRVTLDPKQILENENLIRRARNMVGKRPLPTPDDSYVTPAKRIQSVYNCSKTTAVQSPRDMNTIFGHLQMSPINAPTHPPLLNKHPSPSLGPATTSRIAVQNFQEQASFSPHMMPNNDFNPQNPVLMHYMNHNDTNVRSEDVDLPKRHHCKACLAVFAFKENCDRHYKVVHLKRQVFRCPHCTSSYLQPKTMRSHIDKKHCIRNDQVCIMPCYWCPAKLSNHEEWEVHAAQAHPEQRSKFRGMSP